MDRHVPMFEFRPVEDNRLMERVELSTFDHYLSSTVLSERNQQRVPDVSSVPVRRAFQVSVHLDGVELERNDFLPKIHDDFVDVRMPLAVLGEDQMSVVVSGTSQPEYRPAVGREITAVVVADPFRPRDGFHHFVQRSQVYFRKYLDDIFRLLLLFRLRRHFIS